MEVDGGGGESAGTPSRGKKRAPPSPGTPPSDGDDSSDTSDHGWELSDSGSEEQEDQALDQGTIHPFTVKDFPRLSSDFLEQNSTLYGIPDIFVRGPSPLSLFRAFKDPFIVKKGFHVFGSDYCLHDESATNVNCIKTADCSNGCLCYPTTMLQFIDLKIAGYYHAQPGRAKIFGFFAARDKIEPLRNYVYQRDINYYEAVSVKRKMGMARVSLTSPTRGICMASQILFEFKLCLRTEGPPEDDPKGDILIEGCTEFADMLRSDSYTETCRLYGEKCGLDVKFAVLSSAVQAAIDVEIIRTPAGGLNLKLHAKTSGFSDVIRLFRGVAEAGCRMSSVVAVLIYSYLDICIEGSPNHGNFQTLSSQKWECRFDSCYHGTVEKEMELGDFAAISVKVSWKALDTLD